MGIEAFQGKSIAGSRVPWTEVNFGIGGQCPLLFFIDL